MTQAPDGGADLSAEQSLALIEAQRARVSSELNPDGVSMFGAWGLAWTIGFGFIYLNSFDVLGAPWWVPVGTFYVLLAAALAVTGALIHRAARGTAGPSNQAAAMYGWSYALGFGCLVAINLSLTAQGLTHEQLSLLWPATSLLVVGVLYMAGAAMWRDRVQFVLGAWILAVDAAATPLGLPGAYLVLAGAGGGGFLVAAAYLSVRGRGR